MLLNVRVCALDFAMKALEYRNDFVHPCSTLSHCCQLATTLNAAEVQKTAKIGGFRQQRTTEYTDRDEIWHVSVYFGSAIAHQVWSSSVKGVGTGALKSQNLPKIVVCGHWKLRQ